MKGETHTHKGWYLKYTIGTITGRRRELADTDGAKECRCTVPTGNKVKRE